MIPYIQPIFIPDENHLDINIESIKTFGNYIKEFPYDVKCVFGGWAKTPSYWEQVVNTIEENIDPSNIICINQYDDNYGKAHVVMKEYKNLKDYDFDYFLTADSDIIFPLTTPHLFERLLAIANTLESQTKKTMGFIALNQEKIQCHILRLLKNKYEALNHKQEKEILLYGNKSHGIAGGCIFVGRKAWEKVDGYRVKSVYGGHDGWLLHDMWRNKYICAMAEKISIIHPPNKDREYQNFKREMQIFNRTHKKLDKTMKNSAKFWKKRDK